MNDWWDDLIDGEYSVGGEVWVCLGDLVIDRMVGGKVIFHVRNGAGDLCRFSPDHATDSIEVSEHVEGFVGGVGAPHLSCRQLFGFDIGERCSTF